MKEEKQDLRGETNERRRKETHHMGNGGSQAAYCAIGAYGKPETDVKRKGGFNPPFL